MLEYLFSVKVHLDRIMAEKRQIAEVSGLNIVKSIQQAIFGTVIQKSKSACR